MVDFPGLFHAAKHIVSFPGWGAAEAGTGYWMFTAPLMIGGLVEVGFNLEGGCYSNHPDVNVCIELVLGRTGIRRRTVIERIEWRSLQGGHSNKRKRPNGIPRRTSADHVHSFLLNYNPVLRRLSGDNLPVAEDIPEQLDSFEDLRAFIGNRLNIQNIDLVTRPPWDYNLFHVSGD